MTQITIPEPLWVDTEVSEYLHGKVKPDTLAKWRQLRKGPPFIRVGEGRGSLIFYRPAAVAAWAKDLEINPAGGGM